MPYLRSRKTLFFIFLLFFSTQSAFTQDQSIRIVDIKIATDEGYRSRREWRLEIKRLIANSSRELENRFGIRLNIKSIEPWVSAGSQNSMFALLDNLRKNISKKEHEVVIGFTSQLQLKRDILGMAAYLNGYVLIRRSKSEYVMRMTLLHELCHMFGAIDLEEKGSIMNRENPGDRFDVFTNQIIRLNKYRSFNPYIFPLPKGSLDEAISMYNQRKELDLEEVGIHILLASLYLEKEDYDSMIEEKSIII